MDILACMRLNENSNAYFLISWKYLVFALILTMVLYVLNNVLRLKTIWLIVIGLIVLYLLFYGLSARILANDIELRNKEGGWNISDYNC